MTWIGWIGFVVAIVLLHRRERQLASERADAKKRLEAVVAMSEALARENWKLKKQMSALEQPKTSNDVHNVDVDKWRNLYQRHVFYCHLIRN